MRNRKIKKSRVLEIEDAVLTLSESDTARLSQGVNRNFLRYAWFGALLIFIGLGTRVFYLSVIEGPSYSARAQGNSVRLVPIQAPRGKIFDRSGKTLVYNVPSTDVVLVESYLPEREVIGRSMMDDLTRIFHISSDEVWSIIDALETSGQPRAILKRNISQEETLRFSEMESSLPGVTLTQRVRRYYEDSAMFAHIIGYEGKITPKELEEREEYLLTDSLGRSGLEEFYETSLRGRHGAYRTEVDSLGRVRREIASYDPVPGSDLTLTIDAHLQKALFDSMTAELEKHDLKRAAAVALDPRNGEVLALMSFPSYDNNIFAEGIDAKEYQDLFGNPNTPMYNRAIAGEYPPGSTIKPIIAAAALQEGIISASKQIESRGGIQVGNFYFGDWKAHGFTDVRRALAVSSDVYFYSIGGGYGGMEGLGMSRMKRYNELFGLGSATGIDLLGEKLGFIPDEEWKKETLGERWYVGNSYHASIGQGFVSATPLQMAASMSVFANGGTLYRPYLVSQIHPSQEETVAHTPTVERSDFVSETVLDTVREGMRAVVTEGTAQMLAHMEIAVAGKTGTAQYGVEGKTHGWFVSFAPYKDPEIVLAIIVEGQEDDGYHAVPITKAVYEKFFEDKKF